MPGTYPKQAAELSQSVMKKSSKQYAIPKTEHSNVVDDARYLFAEPINCEWTFYQMVQ